MLGLDWVWWPLAYVMAWSGMLWGLSAPSRLLLAGLGRARLFLVGFAQVSSGGRWPSFWSGRSRCVVPRCGALR